MDQDKMATSETISKTPEDRDTFPLIESIPLKSNQRRTLKQDSYEYLLDSQSKRTYARSNLLGNLKDRGLKGPLKWSRWVSEVNIPDYREECRQLGDPLLFTHHHQLPTPLCKKEEQGDLTEPNSPMATFSYYLKNDSRRIHEKRRKIPTAPGLEREVSISELHRMITAPPVTKEMKRNKNYSPDQMQISIQEQAGIQVNNSAFQCLPRIKLTVKPTIRSHSDNSMSSYSRLGKLYSYSWDNIHSKDYTKNRGITSYEVNLQNKNRFDVDSLEGYLDEKVQDDDDNKEIQKETMKGKTKRHSNIINIYNVKSLKRQSRSDITRDWVYKSPLGPEEADDITLQTFSKKRSDKRKVRFGGGDWIYGDKSNVFN